MKPYESSINENTRIGSFKLKMKFVHYLILLIIVLTSCSKQLKLSEDDLKWQPYQGGETLVFQSESGEVDTIFINANIKSYTGPSDHDWSWIKDQAESISVGYKYSAPKPFKGSQPRYLKGVLLSLSSKDLGEDLWIQFSFRAKGAWFYDSSKFKNELKKIPLSTLVTPYRAFEDIRIIQASEEEYRHRTNYIERMYWSMAEGYVRYDLKDGRYWEMINKYKP